jgi:hypothetical protein
LSENQLQLHMAMVYEPLVAAAGDAHATVFDRMRHGIVSVGAGRLALRSQAASMAASLAARPHRWPEPFRSVHRVDRHQSKRVV